MAGFSTRHRGIDSMDRGDPTTSCKVLVIGFGNTLRGDDGVGPHVAGIVASWELPGLRSMVATQLTPELAEPVAAAERVVFVDARLDTGRGTIKVAPVGLSNSQAMSGHFCDPRFLLSLARS